MPIVISGFAQARLAERVKAHINNKQYSAFYLAAKLDRKREDVRKMLDGAIEMPVEVYLELCREVGAMPWEYSTEFDWIRVAVRQAA